MTRPLLELLVAAKNIVSNDGLRKHSWRIILRSSQLEVSSQIKYPKLYHGFILNGPLILLIAGWWAQYK